MKRYIEFLEKFSQDKQFYARTLSYDGKVEWEVYWSTKLNTDGLWGLKRVTDTEWRLFNAEQLCIAMQFSRVDTEIVKTEMISNIKSMITCAKIMENEVKKLLGPNIVETAMDEFEAFSKALTHLIVEHVPEVSDEALTTRKVKRPKLGLVKSSKKP